LLCLWYMSRRLRSIFGRPTKKTILFVALGVVVVGCIGGGAYAALGGSTLTSSTDSINLQSGLVGWWKMNGNAKDFTPNSGDGTVSGATLASDRKGGANSAYSFSGLGTYISIPFADTLQPKSNITVNAWINVSNATNNEQKIISTTESGGYALFTTGSTADQCAAYQLAFIVSTSSGYRKACAARSLVANGTWSHIVGTYDGNNIALYVNGVLAGSDSYGGATVRYTKSNPTCIGGESTTSACTGGDNFIGSIDDVRIYNRVLSNTEIMQLYEQYDPGIQAASGQNGLVGQWKLDGNAKDNTPYGNEGVVTGTSNVMDRGGKANGAMSFNGTSDYIEIDNFNNPILMQGSESASWTLSAWLKGGTSGVAVGKQGYNSGIMANANGYYFEIWPATGSSSIAVSSTTVDKNKWHLVTATYAARTMTLYIDGVSMGTATGPSTMRSYNNVLGIGSGGFGNWFFDGSIDDVRAYNRALTASEVSVQAKSYNSQINLNSSPTDTTPGNINAGLVGYWPFSGNARDATPYSNNGTVSGATLAPDRKARPNSSYHFSGSSNYIALTNATPFPVGAAARTVCAWGMTTDASGSAKRTMFYYGDVEGSDGLRVSQDGDTLIVGDGTGTDERYSSGVWSNNTWRHICVTYDGIIMRVYVDSIFRVSRTQTFTTVLSNARIGSWVTGTNVWQGSIDELRIYDRELSSDEIKALYASNY